LIQYIHLVHPQWQYQRSLEVFSMFSDLTQEEIVNMIVAGWKKHLPEMSLCAKGME
jgi:hypothetical protein